MVLRAIEKQGLQNYFNKLTEKDLKIKSDKIEGIDEAMHKRYEKQIKEVRKNKGKSESKSRKKVRNIQKEQAKAKKQEEKQRRVGTINSIRGIEFKCSIRQNRLGAFGDYDGNLLDAHCIIKEDKLIIKKSSVITKRSLGDETIYFKNIISLDYQKGDIMQINNNLIIQTNGFGIIRLEYVKDPQYEALNKAWQDFINKPAEPIAVKAIESEVETTSAADELDKWFNLYEKGAITKEEFEAKKKELL